MVEREKVVFLHVPKTGGGAMEYFFYDQFKTIRRNYFLSFFGYDDSRLIRDERSTPPDTGNRCVIERIFAEPQTVSMFRESPHFREAKVLFGHTTSVFGTLFPEYTFRYLAVLREPIERTISNIAQLCWMSSSGINFAGHCTRAEKYSAEHWELVYEILAREYPVPGLLTHENLFLRNCMTRVLEGSRYLDPNEPPSLLRALVAAQQVRVSFYDEFNAGLQRSFDALGIPIDMSQNTRAHHGRPADTEKRRALGRYYNAPQKLIDFVAEQNRVDLELYDILKHQGWLGYRPNAPT